jgi:hypothetical protein
MNLKLSGERNVFFETSPTPGDSEASQTPLAAQKPHFRKRTRSPDEELTARIAKWGAPERCPPELEAIILAKRGEAKVTPDGILLQIENEPYRYWHPESRVCLQQVGQTVLYVRAQNFTDCIHILAPDGEYMETLPTATTPDMFSSEAKQELKKTRRVIDHIHEELKKNHQLTTQEQVARAQKNSEKLQVIEDVIPTALSQRPAADAAAGGTARNTEQNAIEQLSAPRSSARPLTFPRASRLVEAMSEVKSKSSAAEDRLDLYDRIDLVERRLKKSKQPA